MSLDNSFAQAHSALGLARNTAGQYEEAIVSTRRAVELQPGNADVQLFCAFSCLWAGHIEDAYHAVTTALRLDPQYVRGPYLNVLGIVCFCAGRYQEAIDTFKEILTGEVPSGCPR